MLLPTVFTFSVILNSTIPLALSLVSPQRKGLAAGTYFAGGALGGSLFLIILSDLANLPPTPEAFIGAIAFLIVAACVGCVKASTNIK